MTILMCLSLAHAADLKMTDAAQIKELGVELVEVSVDGQIVLGATHERFARLDMEAGQLTETEYESEGRYNVRALDPGGLQLAVGNKDGTIDLIGTGEPLGFERALAEKKVVALGMDGAIVAVDTKGMLAAWSADGTELHRAEVPKTVSNSAAISQTGDVIVSWHGTAMKGDLVITSGGETRTMPSVANVHDLALSPDGQTIAVVTGKAVKTYTTETGVQLRDMPWTTLEGKLGSKPAGAIDLDHPLSRIAYSTDGTLLLVGTSMGQFLALDPVELDKLHSFGFGIPCTAKAVAAGAAWVAGGCGDRLGVWIRPPGP